MKEPAKLARLDEDGWELESAEARHAAHPDTFHIPPRETRERLRPSQAVKLLFRIEAHYADGTSAIGVERMWAIVFRFRPEHVADIETPPRDYVKRKYPCRVDFEEQEAGGRRQEAGGSMTPSERSFQASRGVEWPPPRRRPMQESRRIILFVVCVWSAMLVAPAPGTAQDAAKASAESAKTWLDRRAEIEEYLRTAEVVKLTDIGTGVTKPKKAELAPGGPVAAMAWKPIRPGIYGGFWESYKSEIAAYELDKLLELNMVPPTVERRVRNDLGAAVMWTSPTKSFKELGGPPSAPPEHFESWNLQIIRAKMFDNLIYNKDPNLGNWLVDPAWNLILIDHTRALTRGRDIVHKMTRIDAGLWDRMKALTEESLTAAIGKWLGGGEIRAILQRRDRMQEIIDKMVAEMGAATVFVR